MRTSTFFGCPMWGIPGETISESLVGHGAFEALNAMLMVEFADSGMTILDVGAHVGFFSALAAWIAGPRGQVHSFEPTPSTYAILEKNAVFMRRYCPTVITNNAAVGAEASIATMVICETGMSSRNTLASVPRISNAATLATLHTATIDVPVTTLDGYCASRTIVPGYIKVDAESFEINIIRGARRVLSEARPFISLEVGDCDIPGVPSSKEVVETMAALRYVPVESDSRAVRRHVVQQRYDAARDLLFVPIESSGRIPV